MRPHSALSMSTCSGQSSQEMVGLAACGAGAGAAVAIGAVMPMVSAAAPSVAASFEEKESIG